MALWQTYQGPGALVTTTTKQDGKAIDTVVPFDASSVCVLACSPSKVCPLFISKHVRRYCGNTYFHQLCICQRLNAAKPGSGILETLSDPLMGSGIRWPRSVKFSCPHQQDGWHASESFFIMQGEVGFILQKPESPPCRCRASSICFSGDLPEDLQVIHLWQD